MISVGKRCWGPVSVESVDQVWNKCEPSKVCVDVGYGNVVHGVAHSFIC